MRYHIFHARSLVQTRHDWNVEEEFVREVSKAYLKGNQEIQFHGNSLFIGIKDIQIYENRSTEGVSNILIDALSLATATKQGFSKQYFENTYTNVTDKFLHGYGWGDLRNDYYNIFINDGPKKYSLIVLSKQDVEVFLNEWTIGVSEIWIAGRKIELDNPKSIKIFDIEFEWLCKDAGKIKLGIKRVVETLFESSYSIRAFEHFGKEVTEAWNVKPFGKSKPKVIAFNWDLIHSEIAKVSKSRFKPPHYADAVEAAYKEINKIIKNEYKAIKGEEKDGDRLMKTVFSVDNPLVKLVEQTSESGRNIQQGYMEIFAGAMKGIRNPKAHANVEIDEIDAWEKIMLASHLMKIWDKRIKQSEEPSKTP
ncbi:MAG: TIGR02391 family protein [Cyclobacteriaceae bacterium]